jgi:hypothetical protein
MPVSLDAVRSFVSTANQDQKVTPDEVKQLTSQGPLTAEEKKVLSDGLKSEFFASDADRAQAFAQLGLYDLAPAPVGGNSLADKVENKLLDLAKSQVYQNRDISVADFKLGDHAGVGVKVQMQPLQNSDPLIAKDPHRAATTQRMEDAGQKVTWATVGGGVYPRAGFNFGIPIGGGASFNAGFNASGSIGYSVLAPYPTDLDGIKDLGKNLTVDLPFSSDNAQKMAEGTEVRMMGRGSVAANAGVGYGAQLVDYGNFIQVGASVSGGVGVSKEGDVTVDVKKLEGDKVFVSLSTVDTSSANVNLGAHVGVTSEVEKELPKLGGGLIDQGENALSKAVDSQVAQWASVNLSAVYSRSKTESCKQSWVIDLSKPEGQAAYNDLMHLDARKADTLGMQGPGSPVAYARLDELDQSSHAGASVNLGKINLLSAALNRTETHGTLQTAEGDVTFDRAKLDDSYSGVLSNIFAGKRAMSMEMVQTQKTGAPVESYLHLSQTVKDDKVTTKDDVRRFLALADMLGAGTDQTTKLQDNKDFLGSFGKTDRTIDFFVTDQGLQTLSQASPQQVQQAFAGAYEKLDRPWDMNYLIGGNKGVWTKTPWLATDDKNYGTIMSCLQNYNMADKGSQQLDSQYRYITGRSLNEDAWAYRESQTFQKLVTDLQQAKTPADRAHVFAKANINLDMARQLGALATIAGKDQVLVNNLGLHDSDKGRDISFVHQGAITDPQAEIDRILANPS